MHTIDMMTDSTPADEQTYPKALTCEQSRQVDQLAGEQLGIPSIVLMENAAINAANVAMDLVQNERQLAPFETKVAIFCGGGNNGGDGYAIARHLHNWGADVRLFGVKAVDALQGDARTNALICRNMQLPMTLMENENDYRQAAGECEQMHLWIDALLGTGFHGQVKQPLAALIHSLNETEQPLRLAIDIPSGLDGDSGQPSNATLQCDATITFVSEKVGFRQSESRHYTGDLLVGDIGIPLWLVDQVLGHEDSTRVHWNG